MKRRRKLLLVFAPLLLTLIVGCQLTQRERQEKLRFHLYAIGNAYETAATVYFMDHPDAASATTLEIIHWEGLHEAIRIYLEDCQQLLPDAIAAEGDSFVIDHPKMKYLYRW